jgi:hypothetical protein
MCSVQSSTTVTRYQVYIEETARCLHRLAIHPEVTHMPQPHICRLPGGRSAVAPAATTGRTTVPAAPPATSAPASTTGTGSARPAPAPTPTPSSSPALSTSTASPFPSAPTLALPTSWTSRAGSGAGRTTSPASWSPRYSHLQKQIVGCRICL